jgi:hypothetical protein
LLIDKASIKYHYETRGIYLSFEDGLYIGWFKIVIFSDSDLSNKFFDFRIGMFDNYASVFKY